MFIRIRKIDIYFKFASEKNSANVIIQKDGVNVMYQMAVYCRLSKDDGENKISESIENQMKLIREYVGKSNDLEIADIYIDDGYSGLHFDRPGFQRLLSDIEAGLVNLVLTKDLSRLGRDYIDTGYYLERYFPSRQVRYIALADGIDTFASSSAQNDMGPF